MHLAIVSRHLPEAEGTSSGRVLSALCRGLLADGHTIDVCSWWHEPPTTSLPAWCVWRPLPPEAWIRTKARSLVRPRWDASRLDWDPPPGAIAMAEDPLSFPAVQSARPSVLTQHYLTNLDTKALGHKRPADYQDLRAEARNARRADVLLAYSERVAKALGSRAVPVPMAYEPPAEVVPFVDQPVAAMVANWDWAPNRRSLEWLLQCWPRVRQRVPGSTLLLAGRHFDRAGLGTLAGVEALGAVEHSTDVLARAAVLAFPCPASSGPKVKVLEALSLGLPVLTTLAGAEGLAVTNNREIVLSSVNRFSDALAELLTDTQRRASIGAAGRQAIVDRHGPLPAARARVAALRQALGESEGEEA